MCDLKVIHDDNASPSTGSHYNTTSNQVMANDTNLI